MSSQLGHNWIKLKPKGYWPFWKCQNCGTLFQPELFSAMSDPPEDENLPLEFRTITCADLVVISVHSR